MSVQISAIGNRIFKNRITVFDLEPDLVPITQILESSVPTWFQSEPGTGLPGSNWNLIIEGLDNQVLQSERPVYSAKEPLPKRVFHLPETKKL